jgi:hypothetical protein
MLMVFAAVGFSMRRRRAGRFLPQAAQPRFEARRGRARPFDPTFLDAHFTLLLRIPNAL